MKKKITVLILIVYIALSLVGCDKETPLPIIDAIKDNENSYFQITFIDVGHGDAILLECDRHFMLIDGGGSAEMGDKVFAVMDEQMSKRNNYKLDYLVISHMHQDHYGGIPTILDHLQNTPGGSVLRTWSNTSDSEHKLTEKLDRSYDSKNNFNTYITIPEVNDTYPLGSAEITVISNDASRNNDSLVLLVEYGKSSFLFTGDQEQNMKNTPRNITLLKVAHHGSINSNTSLDDFLDITNPDYAVISCKKSDKIEQTKKNLIDSDIKDSNIYITSEDGNIIVKATKNGKIDVKPERTTP